MSAIVFLPLSQGKVAVIDFEDFEKVRPYKWSAIKKERRWYARREEAGRMLQLHRFLLDAPPGSFVDHKDGDGLNNQRYNIRLCTKKQNGQAFQRKKAGATSKFRGVSWDKFRSRWVVWITLNQKLIHVGRFSNEEDAARAYDEKAIEFFGEYASPNFPKQNAEE